MPIDASGAVGVHAKSARINHQGFFFAPYDADLEQCWLSDMESFDVGAVSWPERVIIIGPDRRIRARPRPGETSAGE